MIPIEKLKPWLIIAAVIILFLNFRMLPTLQAGEYPSEGIIYTSVVMSLLPAAFLVVSLRLLKGGDRAFRTMIGVMALYYAYEFIGGPYTLSLFMNLNLTIWPILVYTIIGSAFLLIAVYAFKQT